MDIENIIFYEEKGLSQEVHLQKENRFCDGAFLVLKEIFGKYHTLIYLCTMVCITPYLKQDIQTPTPL